MVKVKCNRFDCVHNNPMAGRDESDCKLDYIKLGNSGECLHNEFKEAGG